MWNRRKTGVLLFVSGLALALWLGWFWLLAPAPAAYAQQANGIYRPAEDDVVAGVVLVQGTATDPSFLRYELAFLASAGTGSSWIVFAQGDQPVISDTLAVWDTTVGRGAGRPVFPDGPYRLRLRVVRQDYNYDEFFVTNVLVSNDTPTPTPTLTTTVTPTATPTVLSTPDIAAATPDGNVLPTLTPFATLTPKPTALRPVEVEGQQTTTPPAEGLAEQLAEVDTGQFSRAFWLGVRLVAYLFGALAAYLLLRAVWRYGRRYFMSRFMR